MTNFEKYYQKILNKSPGEDISCYLHEERTGIYSCLDYADCPVCRLDSFKWLGEEYKETEVDWSKVKRGTPVMVSHFETGVFNHRRKFFAYDNTLKSPFVTYTKDEKELNLWSYCELAEDEGELVEDKE